MSFNKIAVLGLGKVGTLAAELLHEAGFEVVGFDSRQLRRNRPFRCEQQDISSAEKITESLKPFQAVLSCLPYSSNRDVASAAHKLGIHYFDLTERPYLL